MSVTVERSAAPDPRARIAPPIAPATTVTRRLGRRSGRRVAAGVLLVLATVVTFWQVDLRRHTEESFLAVARPVAAGQMIGEADVRVVRVANASGLALLGADRRAEVVGRTAAVPLAEGSLLTAAQLGPVAWPPAGQAVIAVPVKPGRGPVGLAAGARVVVLVVPAQTGGQAVPQPGSGGAAGVRRAVASVVSVTAGVDQVGTLLVTLLLPAEQAEMIASAAGDVSLVQVGPQG